MSQVQKFWWYMIDLKTRIMVEREDLTLSPRKKKVFWKGLVLLLSKKRTLGERLSQIGKGKKEGSSANVALCGDEYLDIALINSSVTGNKDEWIQD